LYLTAEVVTVQAGVSETADECDSKAELVSACADVMRYSVS